MLQRRMYQVWSSRNGQLEPGPRFRLLADARRYVAEHRRERELAIRTPEGAWWVDEAGRSILGTPRNARPPRPTEPLPAPSTLARGTARIEVRQVLEDAEEITNVEWPPPASR